ncbi:HAD-like domain-containing protein [Nemania serpens]|nr:HAD-like domain-containing protein [Nemania serpens]
MARQQPQPGLRALMTYLQWRGVRRAICTRNFAEPVAHLLGRFLPDVEFAPVVTRDFVPPKPDPAPLLFVAREWGLVRGGAPGAGALVDGAAVEAEAVIETVAKAGAAVEAAAETEAETVAETEEIGDASSLLMVGDSIDDMTAGRLAGAATVLLVNDDNAHLAEHPHTDLVIARLDELVGVLEAGFVGREIPVASSA